MTVEVSENHVDAARSTSFFRNSRCEGNIVPERALVRVDGQQSHQLRISGRGPRRWRHVNRRENNIERFPVMSELMPSKLNCKDAVILSRALQSVDSVMRAH